MPVYPDGTYIQEAEWNRLITDIPSSYTVFKIDSTFYAEANFSGGTDYEKATLVAAVQAALDGLSSGRTAKEKVVYQSQH